MAKEKIVGVTDFKSKCLGLVHDIETGRLSRVVLTKRGRPIAEITRLRAAKKRKGSLWGALRGTVHVMPGVDLTAPSGDAWDAEKGVLFNE